MNNVMLDLETLGTTPSCIVLSIGAAAFDTRQLGPKFYTVINIDSCKRAGLMAEAPAVRWWGEQSREARRVFADARFGPQLPVALLEFSNYLEQFGLKDVKVWGNGSDFDNAILAHCYKVLNLDVPWKFWNNRCYRTLKSLAPACRLERTGTHHNALDDAVSQAQHAMRLLR